MATNRVIYQSEAAYVGPVPATGAHYVDSASSAGTSGYTGLSGNANIGTGLIYQLARIQTANYGFSIPKVGVRQFGELQELDRVPIETPNVNLELSWVLSTFYNERVLGFTMSTGTLTSCISGILNKTADSRNYFIKTHGQGIDANGHLTSIDVPYYVYGFGNGVIANYSSEGAVGQLPIASVSVEALNLKIDSFSTPPIYHPVAGDAKVYYGTGVATLPAINPNDGTPITTWKYELPMATGNPWGYPSDVVPSTLRPGDITLSFGTFNTNQGDLGVTVSDAKIQSYSLTLPVTRTALQKLGSKYAFSKEIDFPVNATLRVTADVGDITTGLLTDFINSNNKYNLTVSLKRPNTTVTQCAYTLKNASLEEQNFTSSIGPNKSVTLTFLAPLGAPQQNAAGLFMSGVN